MKNLEKRILASSLSLIMTSTSLTGCNTVVTPDTLSAVTSEVLPDIISRPKESVQITSESMLNSEPAPTPEIVAKPSVIISRGNRSEPEIAFTFDDSGVGLHKILNICNEKGIKATFFLLAKELEKNPEIWQKAIKDGHQICNHSVGHKMNLGKLSEEEIKKEILGWETVCKNVLGEEYLKKMKSDFPYFRAPGGNKSDRLQQVLGDLGYPITVYWCLEDCWFKTHNPNNYTIVENYVLNAKNGYIFLAHGGTAESVAEIIDKTEAKGYTFKLLSEILD